MNHLFGMNDFTEFKNLLSPSTGPSVPDGYDEEGRSYIFHALKSREASLVISLDKLEEFDSHIQIYVQRLNEKRERPIELKYFQYLSVMFTEIFLSKYFEDPTGFLNELNDYSYEHFDMEFIFTKRDLRKLAFWMATGSGKTLLFHINYYQFQRYNQGPHKLDFDNILLITPSEKLSEQHKKEMDISGVPCIIYRSTTQGYFSPGQDERTIKVLHIHRFTEEKTGSGESIDIEEFGSKNLVFVDEGHKGTSGYRWRAFREFVAQEGFTFEYSATFGQAIASAGRADANALIQEYGKSIVFDYSYRHFYNDGYGKDYRILNLKDSTYSDSWETLLLANALTFYEQKLLFEEKPKLAINYNIEPPLWIFVGSKVTGKQGTSDVLRVVQFLNKLLSEEDWAIGVIKNILDGNSGLLDSNDRDLFSPNYPEKKLQYLRDHGLSPEDVYKDMLKRLFHIPAPSPLQIVNLKNIKGEIGLRAGVSGDFFGVINIGDVSAFLRIVEANDITHYEHDLAISLFDDIEEPDSKVNVLIGAKKFIEGWNSWRVSNMGLLNVGKKEGTQIIQLFGRGVRLRGKDLCLKRSYAYEGVPVPNLRILETLNIFGIEANYMDDFREYLQDEGIEDETMLEVALKIEIEADYLTHELKLPKVDISQFIKKEFFKITGEEDISISVDLNPKVDSLTSLTEDGIQALRANPARKIHDSYIPIIDWNSVYFKLLEYKEERRWHNLTFTKDCLKRIISRDCYEVYCPEPLVTPTKFHEIENLESVILAVLKKYVREVYNHRKRLWSNRNMEIAQLKDDDGNLNFEKYTLKVKESESLILAEVKEHVKDKIDEIRDGEYTSNYISNIYLDRHIYQPLLAESSISISPTGLNEGERKFIEDLRSYFASNQELFTGKDVFVLRNLPRKGVGFYETSHFYPDFMIWVKSDDSQHLIFVDPHGATHMYHGLEDEKLLLTERIKDVQTSLQAMPGGENFYLDSFIVSVTRYNDVKGLFKNKPKDILAEKHLLFQHDDSDYIAKIFNVLENT